MKIKIPNAEVQELLANRSYKYPKYTTQILNLANRNAKGTGPRIVGQMSDLIQEFSGGSMDEWEQWYLERHPETIDMATERVFKMIELLKDAIAQIDKNTVRQWVEELVVVKTYCGLKFQEAILKKVACYKGVDYRLATPGEEAQGIDGYIGEQPVSIKPDTYGVMNELPEQIQVPVIFYEKKKSEIVVEFDI